MRLYVHPFSPNAFKTMVVAEHCGIELETIVVDLPGGEQQRDAFRSINPNGRVPVLVDGAFTLWESNAIMQYLADKADDRALWPDDLRDRADIARWQLWQVGQLGSAAKAYHWENLFKPMLGHGEPDKEVVAAAEPELRACLAVLEQALAKSTYLVGEDLTLADIAVASTLIYAEPAQMPVRDYPTVQRWREAVAAVPAWSNLRPQMKAAA